MPDARPEFKLGQWATLKEIDHPDGNLIQNDIDLADTMGYVPIGRIRYRFGKLANVQGAFTIHSDGEYLEVWATDEQLYYTLTCNYCRVL